MFRNRRSKHNNQKREVIGLDGTVYKCDSYAEGEYYIKELLPMLEHGEITDVKHHTKHELVPKHNNTPTGETARARYYEDDWSYREVATGRLHIIDVKGHPDKMYLYKINEFYYKYPDLAKCYRTVDAKLYAKPREKKVKTKTVVQVFSNTP